MLKSSPSSEREEPISRGSAAAALTASLTALTLLMPGSAKADVPGAKIGQEAATSVEETTEPAAGTNAGEDLFPNLEALLQQCQRDVLLVQRQAGDKAADAVEAARTLRPPRLNYRTSTASGVVEASPLEKVRICEERGDGDVGRWADCLAQRRLPEFGIIEARMPSIDELNPSAATLLSNCALQLQKAKVDLSSASKTSLEMREAILEAYKVRAVSIYARERLVAERLLSSSLGHPEVGFEV